MEDRDDYPIIPQPDGSEETPEKKWLKIRSTQEILDLRLEKINSLQKELASLKEENAKLKKLVKELLQVVNLDEMEEEECNYWRPIIALAKRISDNK